jgi:hypothetical protein
VSFSLQDLRVGRALAVVAVGMSVGVANAPQANAYPASYWTSKTMRVPVSSCVNAALKAVRKSGLSEVTSSSMAAGGHTPTTRGYVVCVRLPQAGACGGDGATAVIVTAGSDAKALVDEISENLGVPVTIDCGPVGNPVNK